MYKEISNLLAQSKELIGQKIIVKGWVKSFRNDRFIIINDGSTIQNIQVVIEKSDFPEEVVESISTAASIMAEGILKESQGAGQSVELIADKIEIYGKADPESLKGTILQPKNHSYEILREQAHLRFKTNTFSAVFRIRHAVSFAIHEFFNKNKFYYIHTPIITGADAEGAGEMFKVTNLDIENPPKTEDGKIDFSEDFFGKETNLTVSGQLEGETAALGLGKIYTFGPTFRAENSNTSRHLAEFWMIEPEMAFYSLKENMELAEDFLKYVIGYVMGNCEDDILFLEKKHLKDEEKLPKDKRNELSLTERLKFVLENPFIKISYTEAIDILKASKPNKKKKFQYPVNEWGVDLQSEHERFLVEKHFKSPVILFNYPANIKAFYMKLNDDEKTVRAMDVLFPGIGEIIGGSEREDRYEVLLEKMKQFDIDEEELYWYLDLRKFGSVPHSGFGLGLERLVMFVTGMTNIRDVIPFPRTPKNAEF